MHSIFYSLSSWPVSLSVLSVSIQKANTAFFIIFQDFLVTSSRYRNTLRCRFLFKSHSYYSQHTFFYSLPYFLLPLELLLPYFTRIYIYFTLQHIHFTLKHIHFTLQHIHFTLQNIHFTPKLTSISKWNGLKLKFKYNTRAF